MTDRQSLSIYPARMLKVARRIPGDREFRAAMDQVNALRRFIQGGESDLTVEQWRAAAEKASKGWDQPGVIKGMTEEQARSGLPREHFLKPTEGANGDR